MLLRFCLYGFLKNQQYYDPFLILAFREKGLSFFMIGLLIAFREILVNAMEIPSGAVADLYGRRRCMILSMSAYVVSFGIFGYATSVPQLFLAMAMFSVGEAFRTGTHKAMILDWLAREGRLDEKTRFYGTTRAWAKMGSALAVLISAAMVFTTGQYSIIFYVTMIPYVFGIINFLGYPAYMDGDRSAGVSMARLFRHLWLALKQSVVDRKLRQLLAETVCYDGVYAATKDYLQPILKQAAIALPIFVAYETDQRAAILVGAVYFVLHLLSSAASLKAHRVVDRFAGEERGARFLWIVNVTLFALLAVDLWFGWHALVIAGFVALATVQNLWRPIQISRISARSEADSTATILSIESQLKSAFVAVIAPLLGLLVDQIARAEGTPTDHRFLPVAILGVVASLIILVATRPLRTEPTEVGDQTADSVEPH
ncbi:MAG: MFS transporter [Phycisphaerae bacterium]|nr:MFS transporter [Phycisphaerae bacterium]